MKPEFKLHRVIETRETLEGRKCKCSRYSLMKLEETGFYSFSGPFLFIYRHYDGAGKLVNRKESAVQEVGYELVNYELTSKQAVNTLNSMRNTIAQVSE